MRDEFCPNCMLILALLLCLILSSLCPAVNSKVVRHTSSSALLKGKTENVVIGSRGTIQLGRAAETMVVKSEDFAGVWSINSIVASAETIYFGTSPNGFIDAPVIRQSTGELQFCVERHTCLFHDTIRII